MAVGRSVETVFVVDISSGAAVPSRARSRLLFGEVGEGWRGAPLQGADLGDRRQWIDELLSVGRVSRQARSVVDLATPASF